MSIKTVKRVRLPVRRDKQLPTTAYGGGTVGWVVGGTSVPSVHNLLTGLQGGTTNEYYHLTQSDYNKVVGFGYPSAGIVVSTGSAWGSSLSISNNINDYVVTMTGSGFNGESNLRFDGNDLYIKSGTNKGIQFQSGSTNYGKVGGTSNGVVIWSADGSMAGRFYNGNVYFNGNVQFRNDADTLTMVSIWENGNLDVGRNLYLNTHQVDSDVAIYFYSYALSTYKPIYWDDYNPTDTLGIRGLSLIDILYISNSGNVGVGTFNPLAKLHVDGNIYGTSTVQNPSFVSGFQGDKWRITAEGDAEFESLFVRGALTVYELLINQLHYQNGGLIIGAGAGKIRSIYNSTQGSEKLYFQDPTGNNYTPFSVGAIVMVQHVDINRSTVVKKIVRQVSAIQSDLRVDLTTTSGWPTSSDVGVFEEGDEVCTIGHVSNSNYQNSIYMSAVDSGNPFLRVFAGVSTYGQWSLSDKSKVKLQIGNLESLAGYDIVPASPGYGLYSNNVYLSGKIVALSGEIGGWTINSSYLAKDTDTGSTSSGMSPTDYPFYAGATYANRASAAFRVTTSGDLTARLSNCYMLNKLSIELSNDSYICGSDNYPLEFPYLVRKSASNNIRNSNNTEKYTSSSEYVKLKSITVYKGLRGTIRFYFEMRTDDSSNTDWAYARIYKNGIAVGSEQMTDFDMYVAKTEDISLICKHGDTLELWARFYHSGGSGTRTYIKNFRLCYDNNPTVEVDTYNDLE